MADGIERMKITGTIPLVLSAESWASEERPWGTGAEKGGFTSIQSAGEEV